MCSVCTDEARLVLLQQRVLHLDHVLHAHCKYHNAKCIILSTASRVFHIYHHMATTPTCCGMPSVMHTISGISASNASRMAPDARHVNTALARQRRWMQTCSKRGRYVNDGGVRLHGVLCLHTRYDAISSVLGSTHVEDGVVDGQAEMGGATFAWGDAAHHLGAVLNRLLRVKRALREQHKPIDTTVQDDMYIRRALDSARAFRRRVCCTHDHARAQPCQPACP